MFIYTESFHAIALGQTLREVTCEECGQEYVYVLDVKVTGTSAHPYGIQRGIGPEVAQANAVARLKEELEKGAEIAPCPQCGCVQRDMLPQGRRGQPIDYILVVSALLTGVPAIFALIMLVDPQPNRSESTLIAQLIGLAIVFTLALPVLIWRLILDQRWNPNNDPLEHRLALARQISMKREDYLKQLERAQDLARPGNRLYEGSAGIEPTKRKATERGHFPF